MNKPYKEESLISVLTTLLGRKLQDKEWYPENLLLADFIPIMLYYNCVQGGYKYGGSKNLEERGKLRLEKSSRA